MRVGWGARQGAVFTNMAQSDRRDLTVSKGLLLRDMPRVAFYCQKCGSGNTPGLDACERCGTPLWLVTEPTTARYEVNHATPYEEHLLERISLLEHYIGRLTNRFDKILEVMLRQAQTAYLDHTLLESLIALLDGTGVVESGAVGAVWQMRQAWDSSQQASTARIALRKQKILAQYKGPETALLTASLDAALPLLEENPGGPGVKQLELSLPLAPDNAALLYLLGESFYIARKPVLARTYLVRALASEPHNGLGQLLSGLLSGDAGESRKAQTLLQTAVQSLGPNVPAHYALGRLYAGAQDWAGALREFKQALAIKRSSEVLYASAYVYYVSSRFKLAERFMRKVLEADEGYAAAWYWLGCWAWQAGDLTEARDCFRNAHEAEPDNETYRQAARRRGRGVNAPPELMPFGQNRRSKKIISGGDEHLAEFLRSETLLLCRTTEMPELSVLPLPEPGNSVLPLPEPGN